MQVLCPLGELSSFGKYFTKSEPSCSLKHFIVNMDTVGNCPTSQQTNGAACNKEQTRSDTPVCQPEPDEAEEVEEVDSAMSQDGVSSDEEGTNREQPQQG